MAKLLKDIVKTKPTKVTNDLGGYSPKAGDEQKFAKKHTIDKYADRNGNGDDVFNATNVKHSQIDDPRHGYKKPEDVKVHEAVKCNMSESDVSCPVHGMKECMSESKLKEDWIVTHSDGKVTKHIGQMDAMRASKKSPGSKVSATHGAMGQKASTVLAPHQRGNMGTFSAAGYTPPEKKKKMKEEVELDETYKKGDYVKHGKTGAVGQIQNISSDKSSVDVKWNKKGYTTSHDSSVIKPMKESLAVPLLGGGDGDESAEMLKTQLKAIANKAMHLVTQLSDDQLIEPWVQSKIAVAKEQVSSVHDYMIYGDHETEKEQTGPDTPMTFPGMNVDVNTGVNV
jgi:preprotein translocase subunit YajC